VVTLTSLTGTTADYTNLEVTNLKAKDGTAAASIADSTGVFTHETNTVFPAGAVGTPSITTAGDTNTGIFFPAADTIAFSGGGAEAMRIDSSGNVGIGTASPSYQLHISGTAPRIELTDTDTGADSYISASSGTGALVISADENNESSGSVMAFRVDGTESMRIDSSGTLLVGTTTDDSFANSNGVFLAPIGAIVLRRENGSCLILRRWSTNGSIVSFRNTSNVNVGEIVTGASATTYATSSDYRLKENVAPMTGALATVAALKPCTYTWKADGSAGQGFIAHELQEVVPDCVTGEKDAVDKDGNPQYQGVDTSFLVATLVKAIQELKAEVDALKGAA
jgi:hypothetical protein